MEKHPSLFSAFITIFRPGLVLAILLTTMLGLGIGHHLAVSINISKAVLGFVLSLLFLEAQSFLEAFYRHPSAPENQMLRSVKVDDPYLTAVTQYQRPALLYISIMFFGAGAFLTTIMAIQGQLSATTYLLLGVGFFLSFLSAFPPVSLSDKGYAEIIESVMVTLLVPAIVLVLQMGEMHILVLLLTIPLTLVYLGMRIIKSLEMYGRDTLLGRQTMLVRIGWQKGMNLHNFALAGCFLLVGIFALIRLPWSLAWPYLLGIPFAIFQILQVQQLANGAKPNWRLLNLTAAATFAITAYMITITLWIR